jgi:2-C-methyl-D-erythritol 4-phosphate cytidylyltransferase
MEIVVVLPEDQIDYYTDLCFRYAFQRYLAVVPGGKERFHSVQNGLAKIDKGEIIAIHDGVRPFVSVETITRAFLGAAEFGAATPVIEPSESIRMIDGDGSKIIDRNQVRLVQTPQVFRSKILMEAYQQEYSPEFTDDTSVVASAGHDIHLVEGNIENIKITRPFDLTIGQAIL